MNSRLSPGRRLRDRIAERTVALPGAFNAISAKLVEAAGFEAVYLSGAGVTNALTGFPDIALLTLTEMAQQAKYVCDAVSLPVVADADTGYGETLNVARAVREFEHAGLAGIHLEDQVAPKRCGHLDGKQVVPAVEMARKIATAVEARQDPDFLVIARTDARAVDGFDAAVERAQLYLSAGADAIFPEALASEKEFEEFALRVDAPLLANMTEFGKSPLLTLDRLSELGYRMVIFPMTQFRVMMKAAEATLADLRLHGTQAAILDRMQTRKELYELIGYDRYDQLDRDIAGRYPAD
jgi:methylisocitrate lyase